MNVIFLSIGRITNISENSMYSDLLRYFRDNGHKVYVVCQRERRVGLPTELKIEDGVEILRVKTCNITKTNLMEKGFATLTLGWLFKKAINKYYKGIKFDLVLYSTPPITIAKTIGYLKKRDHAFTYLMLKDIFPQNALDLGILTKTGWKGWITKYFLVQEKKLYLLSDMLGCMSEANVKFIKDHHLYLDKSRIEVCPNTINPSVPTQLDIRFMREKFNLPMNKMIFVCGGNFGRPQDVTFIIDVLKSNAEKYDRHFVMCGSGTDFHRIKEYSKRNCDSPITVIEGLKKEEFRQLLDACDIGLIFLDHRFTTPNFPSRLLDYMNHSLPVLASTDSSTDIGKVIRNGNFGWWCISKDVNKYISVLDEICANPKELADKGRNSRTYLINHYDTKVAYERIMSTYRNLTR